MNLILIGFSGAGKSYWGKRIAEHLHYSFLDTDVEIEQIENQSVSDIFQNYGEIYFRQKEREIIAQFPSQNTVISTGGGMPCFEDNISFLKQKGRLIYLKASAEYLHQNLMKETHQRPLLSGVYDLLSHIQEQFVIREQYYQQADVVVDVTKSLSVDELIKHINLAFHL